MVDVPVEEARQSATRIERASGRINSLAERFREFEEAIQHDDLSEPVDVRSVAEDLCEEYADSYPDATIEVSGDDEAIVGNHMAVRMLFEIPLENALQYNDQAEPTVSFDIRRSDAGEVTVRLADDGPGLPEVERRVLERGEETPLHHGTGVGLWTLHWLMTRLGGDVSFSENDPSGTVVELTFPASDAADAGIGHPTSDESAR
jgi:signal transduction histidine kinase